MTTLAVTGIVLVITILAFWKKEPMLYMLGVIGWLFTTFYMVNLTYPEENAYLKFAAATFCLSVTLVMTIQVIRAYYSTRIYPPTSSDKQEEHKRKVLNLTKPRKKKEPWL